MRSLPWLLGILAVVLGGIWLTTWRSGAAFAEPVAAAPEGPVESRSATEPSAPTPAPAQVAAIVPAAVDRFVALHRELDEMFGTHGERGVLERVVELGLETRDERAYELVLGTIANPGSKLHGSRSQRDALLRRASGSRAVERFAAETIESVAANHEGFERSEIQSVQVLLASNGLPAGLWLLLEQLAASDSSLVKGAAEALRSARPVDPGLRAELRAALFAELLAPRECSVRYELALALLALDRVAEATSSEARSRPRLLEIAFGGAEVDLLAAQPEDRDALALDIRGRVLLALADAFDADTLRRSIAFYEERPPGNDPDALRDQVPGMWRRLSAPEPDATPEELEAHRELLVPLEQFLLQALTSPASPPIDDVREALRGPAFQPLDPALAAALAELERN